MHARNRAPLLLRHPACTNVVHDSTFQGFCPSKSRRRHGERGAGIAADTGRHRHALACTGMCICLRGNTCVATAVLASRSPHTRALVLPSRSPHPSRAPHTPVRQSPGCPSLGYLLTGIVPERASGRWCQRHLRSRPVRDIGSALALLRACVQRKLRLHSTLPTPLLTLFAGLWASDVHPLYPGIC